MREVRHKWGRRNSRACFTSSPHPSIITPIRAIKSQFLTIKTHFDLQNRNVVDHISTNYLNYYSASLNSSSVYPNM